VTTSGNSIAPSSIGRTRTATDDAPAGPDPIRDALKQAKLLYDIDMKNARKEVLDSLDKREEAAAKASVKIMISGRGVDRVFVLGDAPVFPPAFRNPGSKAPIVILAHGSDAGTSPGEVYAKMPAPK